MVRLSIAKQDFKKYSLGKNAVIVRINEVETDDGYVCYDELHLRCSVNHRHADIVSGLVRANYPPDKMDAVRNNYELVRDGMAGDKTQEYTDEYLAMQEWRCYAKKLASEIMEEYERQHG